MHWDSTLRLGPDRPSGARGAGAELGPVGPVRGEWGWKGYWDSIKSL